MGRTHRVLSACLVAVGICASRAEARAPQQIGVELRCSGSSVDGLTVYVNVTSAPVFAGRPFAIAVSGARTAPNDTRFPELGRPALVLTSRTPFPTLDASGSASIALELPRTLVPLPDQLFFQAGVRYREWNAYSNVLPYTPRGEKFVRVGDLLEARSNHAATRLADGTVLVTGGIGAGYTALATAERFDPAASTFAPAATLSTPRFDHTATMLPRDGRVLLVGGSTSIAGPATGIVELYDPILDGCAVIGNLAIPRTRHAAIGYLDPKSGWQCVLVAGGDGAAAKMAEVFDVSVGKFRLTGKVPHERMGGTLVQLSDGRIAFAGGTDSHGRAQQVVDLFDPATLSWKSSASMLLPRSGATIAPTPDATFMVIGGQYETTGCLECPTRYLHRVERFDPATESFQFGSATCTASRSGACAALLDGGLVFVTGGGETSEVYDSQLGFQTVGCLSAGAGETVTPISSGQALIVGGVVLRRTAWIFAGR